MIRPSDNVCTICHCQALTVTIFEVLRFGWWSVAQLSYYQVTVSDSIDGVKLVFCGLSKAKEQLLEQVSALASDTLDIQ